MPLKTPIPTLHTLWSSLLHTQYISCQASPHIRYIHHLPQTGYLLFPATQEKKKNATTVYTGKDMLDNVKDLL